MFNHHYLIFLSLKIIFLDYLHKLPQAVADGNWVFLKPLNVDQYNIKFKGEVIETIATSGSNFAGLIGWDYQTTYILTIR